MPTAAAGTATDRLGEVATVVGAGDPLDLGVVLADLAERGVQRLMVEGGGHIHTQFLCAELVDEIQLAVAPFFVGDPAAPRVVAPGTFPQNCRNRMNLTDVQQIGDIAFLRYQLNEAANA